jgi:EmrB/QacA subfamily drug resistance transporter
MGQLDTSIVTVALPRLSTDLHAGVGAVEWVSLSYLLTLVALVAPIGSWADAVGRKALYLAGFALFTVASVGCAFAPDLAVLCALRVVQAVGAALLQANSVALIAANSPSGRLGRAVGVQAAAQAIGLALGPALGGLLLTVGSWRLLFLVNVPAGLLGIGTGLLLLPRSRDLAPRRRLDRTGLALFVPAVASALLALSLLAGRGGSQFTAIPVAMLAVGLLAVLVRQQRRAAAPLFDAHLLAEPVFRRGLLAGLAGYAVLFGVLFLVPFFLTTARLATVGAAGLELAALPVGIGVIAPVAGRLSDRRPRLIAVAGLMLTSVCLLAMAALRPTGLTLALLLGLLGVGLGAFTPANNSTVMGAAPRCSTGAAAGLLNMTRGLGTALGTATAAVTFTLITGEHARLPVSVAREGFTVVTVLLAGIAGLAAAACPSRPAAAVFIP